MDFGTSTEALGCHKAQDFCTLARLNEIPGRTDEPMKISLLCAVIHSQS